MNPTPPVHNRADYDNYTLLSYHHIPSVHHLEVFEEAGGYEMMKECFKKDPEAIKEEAERFTVRTGERCEVEITGLPEASSDRRKSRNASSHSIRYARRRSSSCAFGV